MPPIDALQGKELTLAIDDYLTRGVQVGPDYNPEEQEAELNYILHAANRKLTRLTPDERRAIAGMIQDIRNRIAGASQVEAEVS